LHFCIISVHVHHRRLLDNKYHSCCTVLLTGGLPLVMIYLLELPLIMRIPTLLLREFFGDAITIGWLTLLVGLLVKAKSGLFTTTLLY